MNKSLNTALARRTFLSAAGAALAGLQACATPSAQSLRPDAADVDPALTAIPDLPFAKPEDVGMSSAGLRRIKGLIAKHMDAGSMTGGITAVARHNRLVHFQTHGYMDIAARTATTPDTAYYMMSMTKPLVAVALLQQIEAGRVALDDPISRFIPELGAMRVVKANVPPAPPGAPRSFTADQLEPQVREITIQDLATHTSGLNTFTKFLPGDTMATYVRRLEDVPLDFQPGSRWGYSAITGPDVLVHVIELCANQPFGSYLQQRILDPVGMANTAYLPNAAQQGRIARHYELQNGSWAPQVHSIAPATLAYTPGGYGLYATASDYLQFETMLLNRGTVHGRQVLKPSSVELMRSNLVGSRFDAAKLFTESQQGNDFGLLVRIVRDEAVSVSGRPAGAFGWEGYYGTLSWTDPRNDLVAVFMVQQNWDKVRPAQRDFASAIRAALIA